MLDCFSSSFPQSPLQHEGNQCLTSQDYSAGTTPRSNALSSPNVNLSTEFNKLIHTPSFKDIQSKIHAVEEWENGDVNGFVATVIEPNPEDVQKILDHATSNPFTQHLSTYFNHTEQICHLLLNLEQWIHHTRCRYIPINNLVKDLKGDPDSLTQEQCNSASDVFLHFQSKESPFPCRGSHNDMLSCFCHLKEQVNGCLDKPQPRACTSIRFIGSTVKLSIAAATVTAHAFSALLTGSSFPTVPKLSKKDLAHIALLDAAARSTYTLHNELQTIDRLGYQLQTDVESDRTFIGVCTGRGRESYLIWQVVKRLARSYEKIGFLLGELEQYICRFFKGTLESYAAELKQLAMKIFDCIAKDLKIDPEYLRGLFEQDKQSMRMGYYPPCPHSD